MTSHPDLTAPMPDQPPTKPTRGQRAFLATLLRGPRLKMSCDWLPCAAQCYHAGWIKTVGHPTIMRGEGVPAPAYALTESGRMMTDA